MKPLPNLILCLILLGGMFACKQKAIENSEPTTKKDTISDSGFTPDSLHFQKTQKVFVVGDFDGNGIQDTIWQHIISKKQNTELDSIPSPSENDCFDYITAWLYDQDADLCLTFKKDTLHLGTAVGLYCLINLGDLNGDKKDEIAFSVDRTDNSACNTCHIYTICNGKWALLKQFSIHEGAFDFTSDVMPTFKEIKGFLEKQNGKWKYVDYSEYLDSDNPQMKSLKLNKCH